MRALIPGATYRFYLQSGFKDCVAEAGKSLDWGEIVDPVLFAQCLGKNVAPHRRRSGSFK